VTLTAENTAIVIDSTADFPDARERHPNMRVVPLYVRFGEETYRDYVELDPHAFYARLRTAPALPSTSQPTPQDFLSTFQELAGYERIYAIHISSKLSGTFGSASFAAGELGGDRVRLIDTESASVGISMLALGIQRLLQRGTTDDEIEALAARYRERAGLLFTVATLEFLAKGGRIGRAKAFAGGLLNVKPILTIADGEVVPLTRVRGRANALEEFRRRFEAATKPGDGLHVAIAHAEADEAVELLRSLVLATRPEAQIELVTSLGAVVGTHAGPGTVGFFWFQD
jgi:DegV family protein with EDD domain